MSENLERWKAAEKVRSHLGWFAILMGIGGALGVAGGVVMLVLPIAGIETNASITVFEYPMPEVMLILMSIGYILCARGLWRVQPWARWVSIALCVTAVAQYVLVFVRERESESDPGIVVTLFVIAYLLLPSTGRCFARAQGSLPQADAS